MIDEKETIIVTKVHDNDLYLVKQVTTREVKGQDIVRICDEIEVALESAKKEIEEYPKIAKDKIDGLQRHYSILQERLKVFWEYGSKLREAKPEIAESEKK